MAQNLDLTQFFTRDQIRKLLGQKTHSEPLTDGNGNFIADLVSSSCRKQHATRGRGRTARLDPALNPPCTSCHFFSPGPSTVRLRAARGRGNICFPNEH